MASGHRSACSVWDTRQRWRVSGPIGHLADGFRDRVARIHAERGPGFLLESLSIAWLTTTIDGCRRRWDTRDFAVY